MCSISWRKKWEECENSSAYSWKFRVFICYAAWIIWSLLISLWSSVCSINNFCSCLWCTKYITWQPCLNVALVDGKLPCECWNVPSTVLVPNICSRRAGKNGQSLLNRAECSTELTLSDMSGFFGLYSLLCLTFFSLHLDLIWLVRICLFFLPT